MCRTRDELILSYRAFFHLTDVEAAGQILKEGLLPSQTNEIDPGSRRLICLAPAPQIERWRDQIPTAHVMFQIAAEDIITKRYGIDETFDGWESSADLGEVEGLRDMIEEKCTLAVFDRIPPEELTVVEGREFLEAET